MNEKLARRKSEVGNHLAAGETGKWEETMRLWDYVKEGRRDGYVLSFDHVQHLSLGYCLESTNLVSNRLTGEKWGLSGMLNDIGKS